MKKRVLVCGGRNYATKDRSEAARVIDVLGAVYDECDGEIVIIEGGATGADNAAWVWARAFRVQCITEPVSDDEWRAFGKRAGPMRNKRMLDMHQPDIVIAFPGGSGTANMVKLARERQRSARIDVRIIE